MKQDRAEIERLVAEAMTASGIEDLPEAGRERLEIFIGEVSLWSERIHLIGRGNLVQNLRLQLLDSLLVLAAMEKEAPEPLVSEGARLADIGSGAGFPGVVWKIARPGLETVLFERRLKPHVFLERVIAVLDLCGASACGRDARTYVDKGSFDIVVSKAAGRLPQMLPLAEQLLAPGGVYVTIKGTSWGKEPAKLEGVAMELFAAPQLPKGRDAP